MRNLIHLILYLTIYYGEEHYRYRAHIKSTIHKF